LGQVKKKELDERIAKNAAQLFSAQGYHQTSLAMIAGASGIAVGNIYSYFPSKLHLLYRVYRPWFESSLRRLIADVDALPSPRERLSRLLLGLWREIPRQNPRLANSLMEALASADPKEGKPDDLLRWAEGELARLLRRIVPKSRHHLVKGELLSHLLLMAQDGFIINQRLNDLREMEMIVDIVCDMLLGRSAKFGTVGTLGTLDGLGGDHGRTGRHSAGDTADLPDRPKLRVER
jgi:AcrR family transcriptional regulator